VEPVSNHMKYWKACDMMDYNGAWRVSDSGT
jgi:hypothetical protein